MMTLININRSQKGVLLSLNLNVLVEPRGKPACEEARLLLQVPPQNTYLVSCSLGPLAPYPAKVLDILFTQGWGGDIMSIEAKSLRSPLGNGEYLKTENRSKPWGRAEIPLPRSGGGGLLVGCPEQTCIIASLYFQTTGDTNRAELNSERPIQRDCLSGREHVQIGWKKCHLRVSTYKMWCFSFYRLL